MWNEEEYIPEDFMDPDDYELDEVIIDFCRLLLIDRMSGSQTVHLMFVENATTIETILTSYKKEIAVDLKSMFVAS